MKNWIKILLGISLSVMCVFTSIGYAALSSQMLISGTVEAEPPVYDTIVITDVEVCAATTAVQTSSIVPTTNVKFKVTGEAGQKVVYKMTAHNYSQTDTFVLTGISYVDSYASVISSIDISTSSDEANSNKIPASKGTNYYEGTPVAPGEEIEFYATFTLKSKLESAEFMLNFDFAPVVYSITYLVDNEVYAIDCITDNSTAYTVKTSGPNNGNMVFAGWINASGQKVNTYAAGNTRSYTLSATWENIHLIIFVDNQGNVIYQETFTDSSTKLSDEGQQFVDAKLAEMNEQAAEKDLKVTWSDYTIKGSKTDITVRPVVTYNGNLRYTLVDENSDGIIDYYVLDAVSELPSHVTILGDINGIEVKTVNKLYDQDNNFDYSSGVQHVTIEEGVKTLGHNSLAYTESLSVVDLPSTITQIDKNAFSRNFGDDKKQITINFNGTMQEWKNISKDSAWHNGLLSGTRVYCTDGYFELDVSGFIIVKYNWSEHPN